jgi:hypothetical protein
VPGDAAPSSRKVGKEELSVFVEKERVSRAALRDVGGNDTWNWTDQHELECALLSVL